MRDKVIRELMGNYGCTREKAAELVDGAHGQMVIAEADLCQSLPYYPAQQIAEQNFLTHTGRLDDKKKVTEGLKLSHPMLANWWEHTRVHYMDCFDPDCPICREFDLFVEQWGTVEED